MALKIRTEARAKRVQADIFDGSNTVFLLEDASLVADYKPRAAVDWPQSLRDTAGHWTALNLFYWTAAVNTNAVKAEDIPKTYEDLLNPKWKGQIAWTYDLTPGGPPGFIYNILTTMGRISPGGDDFELSCNDQPRSGRTGQVVADGADSAIH